MLLKVTKNQHFNPSLEKKVLEKSQGESNWPFPNLSRVKAIKECEKKEYETKECKFTPNLQSLIAHFSHKNDLLFVCKIGNFIIYFIVCLNIIFFENIAEKKCLSNLIGLIESILLGLISIQRFPRPFFHYPRDYSDRTFLFIKNIYKSKKHYNYQALQYWSLSIIYLYKVESRDYSHFDFWL